MFSRVVVQGKEDQALGSKRAGKERKLDFCLDTLRDHFLKAAFELADGSPRGYIVEEGTVQKAIRGAVVFATGVFTIRQDVPRFVDLEGAAGDVVRGDHRRWEIFDRNEAVPPAAGHTHPVRDESPRQVPPELNPAPGAGYGAHGVCRTSTGRSWE